MSLICPGCKSPIEIETEDGICYKKGDIESHCVDATLGEDDTCPMSGKSYAEALRLNKRSPGPRDWGFPYDPNHQRDIKNPSKPAPR